MKGQERYARPLGAQFVPDSGEMQAGGCWASLPVGASSCNRGVATQPSSGDVICSGAKQPVGGGGGWVSTGLWPRVVTQHCWVLLDMLPVGPAVLLRLQEGGTTLSETTW